MANRLLSLVQTNVFQPCESESDSEERSDILDQAITLVSVFKSVDKDTEAA